MKHILLLIAFIATSVFTLQAQNCSDLFISKYAEGYSNNRAIEVYNPTNQAVDLSQYSVGRFRNGDINFMPQPLPAVMLQPYDTYLAVIDKRDSTGTCFEIPAWNGYQKWDTCRDASTGMPIVDTAGNVIFCVQYQNITCSSGDIPHHLYDNVYNDFLDLQGKADGFFNPTYVSGGNTPFYFNGDDAVALVKGTTLAPDGSNVLDVVGVIGEQPADAWKTWSGYWVTKDRTIVRHPDQEKGTVAIKGITGFPDTLAYSQWDIYPKNTFYVIDGGHECACDPSYVSTKQVNLNDFKIYPNPSTRGVVMVEAEANIETVTILNVMGQELRSFQFNSRNPREEIRFGELNTGIYMMSIRFKDNTITTRKLVVK